MAFASVLLVSGASAAAATPLGPRPVVTGLSVHTGGSQGFQRVVITGHDLTSLQQVIFGDRRARVGQISRRRLVVRSPRSAGGHAVYVRVRTPSGISARTPAARFRYVWQPVVRRVLAPSPGRGQYGGTSVRILGRHLRGVTEVRFGKNTVPARPVSAREVRTRTPSHLPGLVPVRALSAAGASEMTEGSYYRYQEVAYPLRWSSRTVLDQFRGQMSGISCPTADFCMAVDHDSYSVLSGGAWSPLHVLPVANALRGVSCATANWCAATDGTQVQIWDGAQWTPSGPIDTYDRLIDITCPAVGNCIAVDPLEAMYQLTGGSWSLMDSAPHAFGVSCASTVFCVAVGGSTSSQYDGNSWSAPVPVDSVQTLRAVSCASADLCAAVDDSGKATVWNGSTWSAGTPIFPENLNGRSVSCTAGGTCVAESYFGELASFDGADWTTGPALVPLSFAVDVRQIGGPVACRDAGHCVALDAAGESATFDGSRWSAPQPTFASNGAFYSVSCAAADACAATDTDGNAYFYDGRYWSGAYPVDRGLGEVSDVSCSGAARCVAVAGQGGAARWDGAGWSATAPPHSPLDSVSCVADGPCFGLGSDFERLNGKTWTVLGANPTTGVADISCLSRTFCAAAGRGVRAIYDGARWRISGTPVARNDPNGVDQVSCSSLVFCVATDAYTGRWYFYKHGHWTARSYVSDRYPSPVSCVGAFCAVSSLAGFSFTVDGRQGYRSQPKDIQPFESGLSCWAAKSCLAVGVSDVHVARAGGQPVP